MDNQRAVRYLENIMFTGKIENDTQQEVFDLAIKALEKEAFFENTVDIIHDWFVDNKDALLDDAKTIATSKFVEDNVDGYIDDVDLDFIVEDIVDRLQVGILNVLSAFKRDREQ